MLFISEHNKLSKDDTIVVLNKKLEKIAATANAKGPILVEDYKMIFNQVKSIVDEDIFEILQQLIDKHNNKYNSIEALEAKTDSMLSFEIFIRRREDVNLKEKESGIRRDMETFQK